jgi:hypothetical protein
MPYFKYITFTALKIPLQRRGAHVVGGVVDSVMITFDYILLFFIKAKIFLLISNSDSVYQPPRQPQLSLVAATPPLEGNL